MEDATRRTRLANERTYLAWWRTGSFAPLRRGTVALLTAGGIVLGAATVVVLIAVR